MTRKIFFWGLSSGVLSALACILYDRIYFFAMEADFSKLINAGSLIGICMISCLLAAAGYSVAQKLFKSKGEFIFNAVFTILSFASVIIPISISLPLTIDYPELFPALAVPMHFFPAMAWYTLRPWFFENPGL